MPIAIIVHGGAGDIASERIEDAQTGCKEAALIGWHVLQAGGTALDAVEAAVRALEDNPNFNAGTGACLTIDGNIQLDAGIMDGHGLHTGAVADVELIKHPISLARKVLQSPHVMLVGKGAQQFAQEHNIPLCHLEDLLTERQYRRWKASTQATQRESSAHSPQIEANATASDPEEHGTVGAVALDTMGRLAAATSTGGIENKYPGRVGDSPLIGCGFYADEYAAVSCTGQGESFVRLLMAKRATDFVAHGDTARTAAEAAIALLGAKTTGIGGLIVVDRQGNVGFARNSRSMSYAYAVEGMGEPIAGI